MRNLQVGNRRLDLVAGSDNDHYLANLIDRTDAEFDVLCRSLLRPGASVALDVGANIGVTSAILSQHLATGLVYAFEPGSKTFAALQANIEKNELSNIRPVRCAVSRNSGTVSFQEDSAYGHISSGPDGHSVPAVSIDEFVKQQGITRLDLIKIDTEGFEWDVLAGASTTIRDLQPVIYMEFNSWCQVLYSKTNPMDFASWLLESFNHVYVVDAIGRTADLVRDPTKLLHQNMVAGPCVSDLILSSRRIDFPERAATGNISTAAAATGTAPWTIERVVHGVVRRLPFAKTPFWR